MIEIPSFSLGLSQDDALRVVHSPTKITAEEVCELRKSKRTRILPPTLNDYLCDPKIKSLRAEVNAAPTDDNIDEVYLSMRDKAGKNK